MGKPRKRVELSPRLQFGVGKGRTNSKFLKITGIAFLLIAGILGLNVARVVFTNHSNDNSPAAGQVAGASDTANPEEKQVDFISYKVVKGDTLFTISQKYNVSWTTLMTLNHKDSTTIKAGETILIPKQ